MESKKLLSLVILLAAISLNAQVSEVEEWNKKANEANEQAVKLDTTIRSAHQTVTTLTGTLKGILGGKEAKELVLGFSGAEYGDPRLQQISQHFEKMAGVKGISKNFSNGLVTFQIKSNKGVTHLWEELPQDLKSQFRVIQANEQNMLVGHAPQAAPTQMATMKE